MYNAKVQLFFHTTKEKTKKVPNFFGTSFCVGAEGFEPPTLCL